DVAVAFVQRLPATGDVLAFGDGRQGVAGPHHVGAIAGSGRVLLRRTNTTTVDTTTVDTGGKRGDGEARAALPRLEAGRDAVEVPGVGDAGAGLRVVDEVQDAEVPALDRRRCDVGDDVVVSVVTGPDLPRTAADGRGRDLGADRLDLTLPVEPDHEFL